MIFFISVIFFILMNGLFNKFIVYSNPLWKFFSKLFLFNYCITVPFFLYFFKYNITFSALIVQPEFLIELLTLYILLFLSAYIFYSILNKKNIFPKKKYSYTKKISSSVWIFILIGTIFQIILYQRVGWFDGYLGIKSLINNPLSGFGPMVIIAEITPLILAPIIFPKLKKYKAGWFIVIFLSILLLILFGAFRGSRSSFLFRFIVMIGYAYDIGIKFPKKLIISITLVVYLYLITIISFTNNPINSITKNILITDLTRLDTQAILIERVDKNKEFDYGNTYFYSLKRTLIPTFVLNYFDSEKGESLKTVVGTESIMGRAATTRGYRNSYVYGIVGEGLLNFPKFLVIIPVLIFTYICYLINKWRTKLTSVNGYDLIVKNNLIIIPFVIFMSDLDNVIFFFLKNVLLIILIEKICVKKINNY